MREAKAKAAAETAERARAWAEAKDKEKEKAEISRLSNKARKKANFEARARKNANAVNKLTVEATSKIRFSFKI